MSIRTFIQNRVSRLTQPAQPASVGVKIAKAQAANQTPWDHNNAKDYIGYVTDIASTCIAIRASERSALTFTVAERGTRSARAAALQRLIDYPNPVMPRSEFLETISNHIDTTGNALILMVTDGEDLTIGVPSEMWVMPSWAFEMRDEQGRLILADSPSTVPAWYQWNDVLLPAQAILHLRRPTMKSGPYKGRGIVQDIIPSLQTYASIIAAQKRYFDTDGIPFAALQFPQGVTSGDIQADDLRAAWREKFNPASGSSSLAVVPDGGELSFPPSPELGFRESKKELRDSIRLAFQMPPIMLGETEGVNFNNGVTSTTIFRHAVVKRFGEKVADALQKHFQDNISADITVTLDKDAEDTAMLNIPQRASGAQHDPSAV